MTDSVVSVKYGDVIISRVINGWIVKIQDEDMEGAPYLRTAVFQDLEDNDTASAESLANCLWETFSDYTRAKRSAGITFEVKESFIEEEERELSRE
tara:strand:- start:295 stop:582 length:288 start_codon:yes stop_codon:yes gene_type:complete